MKANFNGEVATAQKRGRSPLVLSPEGGFATLLELPDGGVLAAWESGDSIELRRLN